VAELFAAQAALAMGKARAIHQLEEGMRSRQRIGVAVGILMQRYAMSEERAFAYLVRESSHGNRKLRDVAADVVSDFASGLGQA
jgi:AmiR/NasT family two-component response regulator